MVNRCRVSPPRAALVEGEIYQLEVNPDFRPFRRKAEYFEVTETEIKPLVESLDFIANKRSWGFAFARGLFEISRSDFEFIATKIKLDWQKDAPKRIKATRIP